MAPNAKIILVEAVSNSPSDLLGAVKLANNLVGPTGGGEISMSWGTAEFAGEDTLDATFFLTPGVVYFAATGDTPGTEWPSVSANVVAVGGTAISRNPETGDFFGQAAWSDGGGGPSEFNVKPSYQVPSRNSSGVRFVGCLI
jgi:kumamolisin